MSESSTDCWSVGAGWVVPVEGRPIRCGVVRMRGGRIEAVGKKGEVAESRRHEELGEAVVLPGLVNAHCHLELSGMRGRLARGTGMGRWLAGLIAARAGEDEQRRAEAVRSGALELLRGGCTTVGDISHDNEAWKTLKGLAIRKVCFAEVIGVGVRARGALRRLEERLEAVETDERLRCGVSPHAPYSTSESLYRRSVRLARRRGLAVTTHLAETRQERLFLRTGGGMFAALLAEMGLRAEAAGATPVEFARRVGLLERGGGPVLLAHGQYFGKREFAALAEAGASVAYCPRSSEFFGRAGHPYAEMRAAGVNVCLGTDSLASNESLDMLAEARAVAAEGKLDGAAVLRMATINGAEGLGMRDEIGSLEAGTRADWIAVAGGGDDPVRAVLREGAKVVRVVIAGQDVAADGTFSARRRG